MHEAPERDTDQDTTCNFEDSYPRPHCFWRGPTGSRGWCRRLRREPGTRTTRRLRLLLTREVCFSNLHGSGPSSFLLTVEEVGVEEFPGTSCNQLRVNPSRTGRVCHGSLRRGTRPLHGTVHGVPLTTRSLLRWSERRRVSLV